MNTPAPGLFITGTDTEVGKTYIAALIVAAMQKQGVRVGVYKPAASGCTEDGNTSVSDDAKRLWDAAGQPGTLDLVCPQRFISPLAPHLAAKAEGRKIDTDLLRSGLEYWRNHYDFVVVEGIGGLMSPVSDEDYVADLAYEFGYPLLVVTVNELGCINQTLQTLITAAAFRDGLPVVGTILNHRLSGEQDDCSCASNRDEILRCSYPPVLASVAYNGNLDQNIDWLQISQNDSYENERG